MGSMSKASLGFTSKMKLYVVLAMVLAIGNCQPIADPHECPPRYGKRSAEAHECPPVYGKRSASADAKPWLHRNFGYYGWPAYGYGYYGKRSHADYCDTAPLCDFYCASKNRCSIK